MALMWYDDYKNDALLEPVQRPIARLGSGVSCDIYPSPDDLCNVDEFIRWAVASTINRRKLDDTSLLRNFVTDRVTGRTFCSGSALLLYRLRIP